MSSFEAFLKMAIHSEDPELIKQEADACNANPMYMQPGPRNRKRESTMTLKAVRSLCFLKWIFHYASKPGGSNGCLWGSADHFKNPLHRVVDISWGFTLMFGADASAVSLLRINLHRWCHLEPLGYYLYSIYSIYVVQLVYPVVRYLSHVSGAKLITGKCAMPQMRKSLPAALCPFCWFEEILANCIKLL